VSGEADASARLLVRLHELSLLEIDALLAGVPASAQADVLAALADDLLDALFAARRRAAELSRRVARGPEPLLALDAPASARAAGGAAAFVDRVCGAAASRARACRELARLDGAVQLVIPRLADVERLRVGHA
jgi:hypothetical protein